MPPNIEILVSQLKDGCEKAFNELFGLYSPKVINTATKFGIPREESEEMAQDIFLFIWKNKSNLKPELSFNAYILSILKSKIYHRAKQEVKKVAYQKYALNQMEAISNGTENQVYFDELFEISNATIAKLPYQQQQVFLLRNMAHKSSKEISEQLGLSKRTVENHFYIASKTIKTELKKKYHLPLNIISSVAGILFLQFFIF